jgi:hypothetical protein
MRFSSLISISLFFLLSACASTAAYQQQMKQWQGKNIQLVKQQWGQPEAAIKLANGHVLYQYTRKNFYTIPDPKRQPIPLSNTFTSYEKPWNSNQTMIRYCRTTFETNAQDRIINVRFSGNNCLAYRLPH